MDIVEFVNSLNLKISTLEASNAALSKRVEELEEENKRFSAQSGDEAVQLRAQLEEELQRHEFTRLQLEDEQRNVELSVKLLRELQNTSSDVGALQLAVMERESTISKLQQELSAERAERVRMEATVRQIAQDKSNESATRKTLKSMVSVLATQLKHQQSQCHQYEDIIKDQKEEIDRKTRLHLDYFEMDLQNDASSSHTATTDSNSSESNNITKDAYLEELDTRFKTVLDMIEEAEGNTLILDVSSAIKSALRDAKQVIGEEIILAHANLNLERTLRQTALQQLELEKIANTSLMTIVSDLQSQADDLVDTIYDPSEFKVSFVSS